MMTPRLVYTQQHSVTTGGKLLLIFVEINLYFFFNKVCTYFEADKTNNLLKVHFVSQAPVFLYIFLSMCNFVI